jgi:hypothetical protein
MGECSELFSENIRPPTSAAACLPPLWHILSP